MSPHGEISVRRPMARSAQGPGMSRRAAPKANTVARSAEDAQ
jgi:hypothetical protein